MNGWTEPAAAVIVAIYVLARMRAVGFGFLGTYVGLAVAACAAEDSVIRAYGYYGYAPSWSLFADRVPLLVALIWPVVIDSSRALAEAVVGEDPAGDAGPMPMARASKIALLTGAIVLLDASLIEPVSVRAGLWSWTHDGPFHVPWIGVAGWAYFAVAITWLQLRIAASSLVRGAAAIAVTHAVLLVTYYAFFRWVPAAVSDARMCGVAWLVALCAAAWVARGYAVSRVDVRVVMLRAPGALFFFGLLASLDDAPLTLWVYALAFSAPYIAYFVRYAQWAKRPKTIEVTQHSGPSDLPQLGL